MTKESFEKAWITELDGCPRGSEQEHDGFFFKMDPQDGNC